MSYPRSRDVVSDEYSVHIVDTNSQRSGAQAIHRAAALLKELSAAGQSGRKTSELARLAGLSRPTTYRILSALESEGFVDIDPSSGSWFLGPEMFVLGSVAAHRFDISSSARRMLKHLSQSTGESAFFSVVRGDETVCLLREDGSFPLRSFVLYEGVRFPLGVASAGLATLAFLPDEAINDYLARAALTDQFGQSHSPQALWQRIRETRKRGYAVNPGLLVEGSWGVAASIFDQDGLPRWALSLTGVESRFAAKRIPVLGRILLESAHHLSTLAQSGRAQ